MSGTSYTSGSVRSGAGSVRLGPGAGHEVVLDALYDRKRDKKTVRVLTVVVYVFSVSLAAIMLSLYYVFFWEPKDAHYAQRKVSNTVTPQTSTTPMPTCFLSHTGGSDTTVNETATPPTLDSFDNFTNTNETMETTDAIVEYVETSTIPSEEDYTSNVNETLNVTIIT